VNERCVFFSPGREGEKKKKEGNCVLYLRASMSREGKERGGHAQPSSARQPAARNEKREKKKRLPYLHVFGTWKGKGEEGERKLFSSQLPTDLPVEKGEGGEIRPTPSSAFSARRIREGKEEKKGGGGRSPCDLEKKKGREAPLFHLVFEVEMKKKKKGDQASLQSRKELDP